MKKSLLIIIFFLLTARAYSQVVVTFIPEVYGRNVNGLFNVKLTNLKQKVTATLTITVTERKAGTVCIVKTTNFDIYPGTNPIPVTAARNSAIQFSNNKLGQMTGLSHSFPEGDYDYCFDLSFLHSDIAPDEQCFSYTLAPFADLSLIDPYNEDKICDKRPLFTWQPLVPGVSGSYYQLVLAEVKTGQNATEALNYNLPIVNQSSIISPVLPYPAIARELEKNKKYAWQVTAYKDQAILNRSEIWEFTVNCQDTVKKVTNDGYRDIEDLLKGNFYVAVGQILFSVVNPYQAQNLKYEIQGISNPNKKVKGLPKIKLMSGENNITVNLQDTGSFENGKYYIMNVWLPNGAQKSLRFLYHDPK